MSTDRLTPPAEQHAPSTDLVDLSKRSDHYAVISSAASCPAQDGNDWQMRILAARSYIALGLVGPARELLSAITDDSSPMDPDGDREGAAPASSAAQIARCIMKAPSGRLAWCRFQPRFERNVRRLYERHPALQAHDAIFRALPRKLELYESIDGNVHVSERSRDATRRWIPDLCDARRLSNAVRLGHEPNALFCGPYLIVADRRGMLLERVFRSTSKMFLSFTPRIYVVEPDVELFGVAMYLAESVQSWCDERVEVFVGPGAFDALVDHFETHQNRTLPQYMLTGRTEPHAACDQALDRLRAMDEARTQESQQVRAALETEYDALPPEHWHRRYTDGSPLRVLGLTSRFTTYLQYSMRDCKAAFERLGHEFELLIEDDDHELRSAGANVEAIARLKPDLIIIIDHLRAEYPDTIPNNVPYVCWIQDQLPNLTNKAAGRSMRPLDFYIAPELEQFVQRYDYPADQGLARTMATDDTFFSPDPMPEEMLGPCRCDFSFVSSQSKQPRIFHEELVRSLGRSASGARLIEYLFEAITRSNAEDPRTAGVHSAIALLKRAKRDIGIAGASPEIEDAIARQYIHPLRELIYRQTALEWVADYCDQTGRTLHLYGNGWSDHPRFARYARGFAENGEQLRAIYQASRINLQITSFGAVHQRLLDGLAAGGFFLIRYCPTDVIHEPVKRFLSLAAKHDIQPDSDYRVEDFPEVAKIWRTIRELHGDRCRGPSFRITEAELTRLRGLADSGYRSVAGAVFERYGEVSFANAEEFARLADRYLNDESACRETVLSMRRAVVDRFTYTALVTDLLAFLQDRLGRCRPLVLSPI